MAYPSTCRSFRRTTGPYPLSIVPATETLPESLAPHDVLIRMHAVALNYRDIAMLQEGGYPAPVASGGIPANDCAAEVVAVGDAVQTFAIGDRVAPTVDLANLTGNERNNDLKATGGNQPGVLTEYSVFQDSVLVKLPRHLSWEEASVIACAGVTAWVALGALKDVRDDTTALMQGTGGVSMFALLICLAAGIRPIITSSSDSKLAQLQKLSPKIAVINYKKHSNVAAEALRLTDGKGVDYVLNVTGTASIPSDLEMLRKRGGSVALIGFLEGLHADWKPDVLLGFLIKAAKLQGILAGSRDDFAALNKFLEAKTVHLDSIIDRTFAFEDSVAAFEYLRSGTHVGKIVIKF